MSGISPAPNALELGWGGDYFERVLVSWRTLRAKLRILVLLLGV